MEAISKILIKFHIAGCVVLLSFQAAAAVEIPAHTSDGFAIPQPGRQFLFPRDHGSHPEFAIEWWYVTGHLTASNQLQYGFQATFFRRALAKPGPPVGPTSSTFGNDQIYLAHMALLEKDTGTFHYQERLNRAGWDAMAATSTLDVRNGNWSLRLSPEKSKLKGYEVFELQFTVGPDVSLMLELTPKKPLVVFGKNGVSRKAADPSSSSHYLTYPRLASHGVLNLAEINATVEGEAWMDHEFSSSQLGTGQVGWDWLCLQLNDGRELMAYRMRRADGTTDPFSTVAWIDLQSTARHIGPDQFTWTTLQYWHSNKTSSNYPSSVKVEAKNPASGKKEVFNLQPIVLDQELTGNIGGVAYWEGACSVLDENKNKIGKAYMELTGYTESLKEKF